MEISWTVSFLTPIVLKFLEYKVYNIKDGKKPSPTICELGTYLSTFKLLIEDNGNAQATPTAQDPDMEELTRGILDILTTPNDRSTSTDYHTPSQQLDGIYHPPCNPHPPPHRRLQRNMPPTPPTEPHLTLRSSSPHQAHTMTAKRLT